MRAIIHILLFLIILIGCTTKRKIIYDVKPARRPQYEKRIPSKSDSLTVDSFFKDWISASQPITKSEYDDLDSIEILGYEVYESLIRDTTFIGVGKGLQGFKYFLIPNIFRVSIAKNYNKKYDLVLYDSLETFVINDFRPKIEIDNQILYFTKEYQDTLPKFAEKYGVGGFIRLDSYLMSNHLRYFETAPVINGFTYLTDSGFYIIDYKKGSNSYVTLVKRHENKWIKIEDLIILTSD